MTVKSSSFQSGKLFEFEPTSGTKRLFNSSRDVPSVGLDFPSGYVWTVVGVVFATAVLCVLKRFLSAGDESLLYLPVVIIAALRFGFGPAVLGALFSFCCWDYFFDVPYYALTISSAHDCISLVIYLVVAVTIARLTSRAKVRAREAEARERETTMLYKASSALSCELDTDRLLLTLAEQIVFLCRASRCTVYLWIENDNAFVVGANSAVNEPESHWDPEIEQAALSAVELDQTIRVRSADNSPDLLVPLDVHGRTVGVLFVGASTDGAERSVQEERMIMTLANHAAVVIARQHMAEDAKRQVQHTAVLDERNRLARDVHDTLSHSFTGIKFLLEAANTIVSPDDVRNCIVQARNLAIEGAQEARRSVLALRPAALEDSGSLVDAIRTLADQKAAGGSVGIKTVVSGVQQALPPKMEENLLRIAQEAMTNALRHSFATDIMVSVAFSTELLELIIADNGNGFDPELTRTGFGLTSMRERTALIGGQITIGPAYDRGTSVCVTVPIVSDKGK